MRASLRVCVLASLAVTVGLGVTPAIAELPITNAQTGQPIPGNTYLNTAGARTVFQNPSGTSQPLPGIQGSSNVIGNVTGGGQAIHFNVPSQTVRVDGSVDVSTTGNGKVFIATGGQTLPQRPVNTVNNGRIIKSGTYFNTADGVTTFKNTTGGGLWLQKGGNLRILEVDVNGNYTNHGGAVHLYAPGQVVRLDGNIDARALRNGDGAFIGNGGKVFVDSAYLYQSGNIYANGINGGLVQFNVGSATLAGTARIEAKGFGGLGGIVAINASGVVDVQRQTIIDTSGKVAGTIDTNLINIEGGLVNVEGTLQANGIESRGGTIRLVSTGQTDLSQAQGAIQDALNGEMYTEDEAEQANNRLSTLKTFYEGDTRIASGDSTVRQAIVTTQALAGKAATVANDSADPDLRAGDGGTIIITAKNRILNGGWLLADGAQGVRNEDGSPTSGGNGGTISLNAGNEIITSGRMTVKGGHGSSSSTEEQGGKGGDAGLIALSYTNGLANHGSIIAMGGNGGQGTVSRAAGGNGGLVVFGGNTPPEGSGQVITYGGEGNLKGSLGSIVARNAAASTNSLIGVWRPLSELELLNHAENVIFIAKSGNGFIHDGYLYEYMRHSHLRSPQYQAGSLVIFGAFEGDITLSNHDAVNEYYVKLQNLKVSRPYLFRNLVLSAVGPHSPLIEIDPRGLAYAKSGGGSTDISMRSLNTVTAISANGTMGFRPPRGQEFVLGNGPGGGRLSVISKRILADDRASEINLNGGITGGSINMVANDNHYHGFPSIQLAGTHHGGSLILKAGQDLSIGDFASYDGIKTNGGLMGGTQQLFAGNNLDVDSNVEANGGITGGSIWFQAGQNINTKTFQVNGGITEGRVSLQAGQSINIESVQANGG